MATRIIEYGGRARQGDFPVVPAEQKLVEQTPITPTTTSAQSAAFGVDTQIVCIDPDEDVYVNFGTNPTAATTSRKVYAKQQMDFAVPPGLSWKVAVRT